MANQNSAANRMISHSIYNLMKQEHHPPMLQNFSESPFMLDSLTPMKCMLPTNMLEEEPVFVNARQYERILKRRVAKTREQDTVTPKEKKPYKHESRHSHACKRERGPSGAFLPKDKVEPKPKKKVKYSRYSAACVLYGMPPDD